MLPRPALEVDEVEPPEHARAAASGAASTRGGDPMVGRLLDRRYRIGARIARGGMASVYEATDMRLDRTVAVKIMHPGLGDDDEFAQRFVREARAAARLNHPHVVGVYDQGDDDGTVFLVMEFVPGHTLRDVIRKESPMPAARALQLLEPVVSALAAAHRAGLIHRDVKPENVLISDAGSVKVADFGLAKAVSADTQHTATSGILIGTVSYLAPELVVEGHADARADVYAAGVVLYELLTGAKPHEGESPIQVAYRHVHHDVPPPSALVPGLPDFVDALVARTTSRDRTQRPADAGVLLHHLHRVGQALRDGVTSDTELAADLTPRPVREHDTSDSEDDTSPQAFDAAALTLLTEVDHAATSDHTTAIERQSIPVPVEAPRTTAQPVVPARRPPSRPASVATTARRRSRKGPLVLLLALLLVGGLGAGAWWFGWERYTTTPAVLGLNESSATARLERAGLEVATADPAFSESVPAGRVIKTQPGPGAKVLDGGTVAVTLSLGPERYDVPKLAGMEEDQARDALSELRLAFGTSKERWSEEVPAGQVMSSAPVAGTTLKPGDTVNLVISKGRKPIKLRDWTGRSFSRAQAALEKRGLVAEVADEQYSDTVADGDVISQDPTTGTLFRGEKVSFVVSQGPELVEVPGTRAMGVEAATEELEALGFVVKVEESSNYIGVGFVFNSDPEAGDMVPKGSTITLYLI